MFKSVIKTAFVVGAAHLALASSSATAAVFWAVESGGSATSNADRSVLDVDSGANSFDIYFDTEGDTSNGWDLDFTVAGSGTVSNVTGAFVDPADGVVRPNGGYTQIGGNPRGEQGSEVLIMSLDFLLEAGSSVTLSGSYTDVNFRDSAVPDTLLVQTPAVPLPAAAWLFGSALLGLVGFNRNRQLN